MARCRSVPALVGLTPRTSASSALESSAWYLSAITSRSRGGQRRERGADGVALRGELGRLVGAGGSAAARASRRSAARLRLRSSSSAALRTMPNSHARGEPRRASKRERRLYARSNAWAVTSSAAALSRRSVAA